MKILSDSVKDVSKYVQLHSTQYEDNKGNIKEWSWIGRPNNTKAVMIIPIVVSESDNNKLCIIKEFRVPIKDYEWGFPAGLIDANESVEVCIERELKEETGLDLELIYEVTPFAYNTPGITDESIAIAFVKASGELSTDNLEASEDIEQFLLNQGEVAELLFQPDKKFGAKALLIMKYFARTNHIA